MNSPGRAGDTYREASNADKSYVDNRPIAPLVLMSGNVTTLHESKDFY